MPFLFPCFYTKSTSEMSTLKKMMKFLVSDELSFFHWLLNDLITGKNSPPTGGELLRHPDRSTTTTQQFESTAMNILLKIVPTLSMSIQGFLLLVFRLSSTDSFLLHQVFVLSKANSYLFLPVYMLSELTVSICFQCAKLG